MPVVLTADRKNADPRVTRKTADTAIVVLAIENPYRRSFYVYNDSTAVCYLLHGAGASTTNFTVQIAAGGFYEMPKDALTGLADHSGQVTAVWGAVNGAAQVTEYPAQAGV